MATNNTTSNDIIEQFEKTQKELAEKMPFCFQLLNKNDIRETGTQVSPPLKVKKYNTQTHRCSGLYKMISRI